MTALYTLTGQYARLQELAEAGEDVSAELDQLHDAIDAKGAALCAVIANLEADAAAYGAEEDRLGARRKAAENQVERLRTYIRTHMQAAGIERIKGPHFTITLSPGQERVVITDASKLPAEFVRTKTTSEPDKKALLAAYKSTGEVPSGVEIHETTTLRIR